MGDFWFGKRVLVTGGDGFVAANLTAALIRRGAVVTVTSRHARPYDIGELLGLNERPDVEYTDMSDYTQVQSICSRHQIDTIFHLAASAIVQDSARSPMSTFTNNIIPTLNLLEAARVNNIPRVIIASTDKSYGDHAGANDPEPLPYVEQHALRGLDVYSASKAAMDLMAQTYAFQYSLPIIIVRSCNIYGPGDLNFTRLIPRTTLRLANGHAPVINLGNADVLREYVFIDDLVNAYMFLGAHVDKHYASPMPRTGRETYGWSAYNIGSYSASLGHPIEDFSNIRSVRQVIDMLRKELGSDLEPETIPKAENFIEIPDQFLDSKKLHDFGFVPEVEFADGLRRSVEWYTKNQSLLTRLGARWT